MLQLFYEGGDSKTPFGELGGSADEDLTEDCELAECLRGWHELHPPAIPLIMKWNFCGNEHHTSLIIGSKPKSNWFSCVVKCLHCVHVKFSLLLESASAPSLRCESER